MMLLTLITLPSNLLSYSREIVGIYVELLRLFVIAIMV